MTRGDTGAAVAVRLRHDPVGVLDISLAEKTIERLFDDGVPGHSCRYVVSCEYEMSALILLDHIFSDSV